tara:strand:- start:624 stop:1223 length:600 start_codon:yes stop_codon:yes gene_type:complete
MKQLSIPLFPLNGAIIFPGTSLPLNIFEERYLSMVDYALATERLIGMIQSSDKGSLFSVGCFGKINSFNETVGNRYIINVLGKHYFKIIKHKKTSKNFIKADIEILDQQKKTFGYNFDKKLLIKKYKNFIKDIDAQIDFEIIDKISNEELVKFIAMSCPFSKEDKQMLLETYDLNDMGNKLVSLFEFYPTASANKKSLN